MIKLSFFRAAGLALLALPGMALATDYDIGAGGNWSSSNSWDPNTGTPGGSDTITINSLPAGRTISIDVAPTIAGLSYNDVFTVTFNPTGGNRTVTINGDLLKANTGTMAFRSTSGNLLSLSVSGSLAVSGGALFLGQAGDNNTASTISVTGPLSISSGATVGVRATTQNYGETTINGSMTFYGNNDSTATFSGLSGSGVISGTASGAARIRTYQLNKASGTTSYSGNITEVASSLMKVTKQGNYTQVLSGSNNYVGQTLVSAGTLIVSGTHRDGTATTSATANTGYNTATTGHFQVESGATLGGSGYIAGNSSVANSNMVYVKNGGVLAPGDTGIGALTLDGEFITASANVLSLASGADFTFQLAGNGGTPDQIRFWNYEAGEFALNNNEINLSLVGTQVAGTYTVDLFLFYTNAGITLGGNDITTGLVVGTVGPGISVGGSPFTYDGEKISLTYTVIPEPGSAGLILLGLGALASMRRSRRRA